MKKFLSVFLAAVLLLSSTALGILADNMTTVKLTVPEKNVYTMTIPALTTMNPDGSATALTNGLNVKGSNMQDGKKVTVTINGKNDWNLSATGKESKIGYAVYEADTCTEADKVTAVDFSKEEIEAENGTTKNLWILPDAVDLDAAVSGDYTGYITFTAELTNTALCAADALKTGAECKFRFINPNTTETIIIGEKTADGITRTAIVDEDGSDLSTISGFEKYTLSIVDSKHIKYENQNLTMIVYTEDDSYSITGDRASDFTFAGFFVKPAGASEFEAVELTAKK